MFWRVFGGTIFSIVALVIITAYTQMTGTISDLRKELTQVQADLLKKDEFNNRLTSMWNSIKDLQSANTTLAALNERFKHIDQQMNNQSQNRDDERKELLRKVSEQRKAGEDERKELQHRIDDLCQKVQSQAERLAALEGRQSSPNVSGGKSIPIPLLPNRKTKPGTQ
jgi:chromosome segregation ATPase